ncbi:DUF4031 domain-containing protein [uncultured Herbaspirillum sp.]|uniref:DUF4031 domain-containing protein n=1 Tax=uncultured Herbaspirillum sp. TaxID=160236 RepID=UPI002584AFB0|nr:DUF4031 domain-containing protein [uncultured Herbaspirillum sp.]
MITYSQAIPCSLGTEQRNRKRGGTLGIYVDNAQIAWRGRLWCHLVADSLDELHQFARSIGQKRAWFQADASLPHYDITVEARVMALSLGAIPADRRTLISRGHQLKRELLLSRSKAEAQLQLF